MIQRHASAAIDYSDSSMSEARTSLGSISTFIHDAQAYMKGQLQCSPVQEAFLWERYTTPIAWVYYLSPCCYISEYVIIV